MIRAMHIQAWGKSDVGRRRENNQDSFLINPDLRLYVVADGMGGHRGGEVASSMAVQTLDETITKGFAENPNLDPRLALNRGFVLASELIFDRGLREPSLKGMATTMVAILVRNDVLYIANVGDSRVYLIRPPRGWLLTDDHSLFNEQLKMGMLEDEDRDTFEGRNIVTRSVGFERLTHCDIIERKCGEPESFLLCSDGLSNQVDLQTMVSVVRESPKDQVASRLVARANDEGGEDNITALFLDLSPD